MFKVGNVVQRLEEYQASGGWRYEDKLFIIESIQNNNFLSFEEKIGIWSSFRFRLVSQTKQSYPFIKEIPAQKAHRRIIIGDITKGIKIIDTSYDYVELRFYQPEVKYNEKELRDLANKINAIADVLKENSHD